MTDLACPPPDPDPHAPKFAMPPKATDTHAHLFGPADAYPYGAGRGYTPPDALLADYQHLHRVLGVSRGVLTQPSVYGTDNRLLLDVLRANPATMRGVAAVEESVTDAELEAMDRIGVRGIRVNLVDKGGMPYDSFAAVETLAARIRGLGWHVELLVHVHDYPNFRGVMSRLPVDISVGHLGYMPAGLGIDHPGFREFVALLRDGRCWVKLTGSYRVTGLKQTPYADVTPIARALVEARPDRILWGTDWPHPICKIPMPNDGDLLDQLADWVPDETTRRRILVDNPAVLYRY